MLRVLARVAPRLVAARRCPRPSARGQRWATRDPTQERACARGPRRRLGGGGHAGALPEAVRADANLSRSEAPVLLPTAPPVALWAQKVRLRPARLRRCPRYALPPGPRPRCNDEPDDECAIYHRDRASVGTTPAPGATGGWRRGSCDCQRRSRRRRRSADPYRPGQRPGPDHPTHRSSPAPALAQRSHRSFLAS